MESELRISKNFRERLQMFTNFAILGTLIILALKFLSSVLLPFVVALMIFFLMKPIAEMFRRGAPVHRSMSFLPLIWEDKESEKFRLIQFNIGLAYSMTMIIFVGIAVLTGWMVYEQVSSLAENTAKYQDKVDELLVSLDNTTIFGQSISIEEINNAIKEYDIDGLVSSVMSSTAMVFANSLTVLFFLVFIIAEATLLPGRIAKAWPGSTKKKIKSVAIQIEKSINKYIVVKSALSLGTALCTAIILIIFGIELWFVWSVLTFFLNYVPYIGSLIATLPPVLLGILVLDPTWAIVLVILLISNQQLWGNIIETKWTGEHLDTSPVLLLIVVAFWYWLWGVVGMIIAVPLTVIIRIIFENVETTQPLAILMSERAPSLLVLYERAYSNWEIDEEELENLKLLNAELELSDADAAKIATKAAINVAMMDNMLSEDEWPHIEGHAKMAGLSNDEMKNLKRILSIGKISKSDRKVLDEMLGKLSGEFTI